MKDKKDKLIIILGIISFVLFIALIVILSTNLMANGGKNSSSYNLNYRNYNFEIPNDFTYSAEGNNVLLINEEGKYSSSLDIVYGSYKSLNTNKDKLKNTYEKAGYEVGKIETTKVNNKEYVTAELKQIDTKILLAFTEGEDNKILGTTIVSEDNEYNYDALKTMNKILSSINQSKVNGMHFMQASVDMSGIPLISK